MSRKQSTSRHKMVEFIESTAVLGIKLGLVAFVIVLAYVVYGLASGKALTATQGLTHGDRLRILTNMASACKALGVCWTVLVVSTAVRYYAEEMLGYGMSLLGIVLYFGTPWMLAVSYTEADIRANPSLGMIGAESRVLAVVALILGTLLVIRDVFYRIGQSKLARIRQAEKNKFKSFVVGDVDSVEEPPKPGMYAKCWNMSFCTGFVRQYCPAFEAKKSCWQVKCGCLCDEKTILRALMIKGGDDGNIKKELDIRGLTANAPELSSAQKRERCRNCTIFQFHQHQKYRLISPIIPVAVLVLMYGLFSMLQEWFMVAVKYTDAFVTKVSFLPQHGQATHSVSSMPEFVFWLFIIWLGIMVVSYTLKFVEFCVFKLQI